MKALPSYLDIMFTLNEYAETLKLALPFPGEKNSTLEMMKNDVSLMISDVKEKLFYLQDRFISTQINAWDPVDDEAYAEIDVFVKDLNVRMQTVQKSLLSQKQSKVLKSELNDDYTTILSQAVSPDKKMLN